MAGDRRQENPGRGLLGRRRPSRAEEDPTIDAFASERARDAVAAPRPLGDPSGTGGALERLYAGLEPSPGPSSSELPPLPPLSSGPTPRENTWPIPEREETTLAEEQPPRRTGDRPPRPATGRGAPPAAESFDEVPPGAEDLESLLGPVDEFTLSAGPAVRKLAAALAEPRPGAARSDADPSDGAPSDTGRTDAGEPWRPPSDPWGDADRGEPPRESARATPVRAEPRPESGSRSTPVRAERRSAPPEPAPPPEPAGRPRRSLVRPSPPGPSSAPEPPPRREEGEEVSDAGVRMPPAPAPARVPRVNPSSAPPRPGAADPLTTGVVAVPDDLLRAPPPAPRPPVRGLSDATAALMFDEFDPVPAAPGEPSIGLPEVPMPPDDTGRARGLQRGQGVPAISLDPGPAFSARELAEAASRDDAGQDVEVMESPAAIAGEPPPARMDPRPRSAAPPASPAGTPMSPPPRSGLPLARRPASRPAAAEAGPSTRPVALGAPAAPDAPPPRAPASRPGSAPPRAPDTAAVQRLDQLLTLADEPPEREETIGASLELMKLTEAPPEQEDSLGDALQQVPAAPPSPPRAPDPLPSVFDDSPVGEETIGHALEPLDPAPPEEDPLATRPIHRDEDRPAPDVDPLATRPIAESDRARPGEVDEASLPMPVETVFQEPHDRSVSTAQYRRSTWRPEGTAPEPAPPARPDPTARPPREERPSREKPAEPAFEPAGSPLQDPLVVGAAALFGLLVFFVVSLAAILFLAYVV